MAKSKAKSKAKAKAKETSLENVVANARLVEAIQGWERSKLEAKTYLIQMAEICQSEQLSRPEIIASLMEAKGIEKASAESQYSRMRKILEDNETLEALRSGEIDLKTARERTTKKQAKPSAKKKEENLEKRYQKWVTTGIEIVKEMGSDIQSVLHSLKVSFKKAGIK